MCLQFTEQQVLDAIAKQNLKKASDKLEITYQKDEQVVLCINDLVIYTTAYIDSVVISVVNRAKNSVLHSKQIFYDEKDTRQKEDFYDKK